MLQSMRDVLGAAGLQNGEHCSHPGLALERYLAAQTESGKNDDRAKLLTTVADIPPSDLYAQAFQRWTQVTRAETIATAYVRVQDRMIVGLSSENVLETAVALHRTYGAPLIPGSALKGLSRHYWLHQANDDTEHARILFGDTESAAYLTYFDAWYVPNSAPRNRPLQQDVITVHHPAYYADDGKTPPTDFDDPNPVSFLSVIGQFYLAVQGPTPEWAAFARDVLLQALHDYGIGGKTSSGYGRLTPVGSPDSTPGAPGAPLAAAVAPKTAGSQLEQTIDGLRSRDVNGRIGSCIDQWRKLAEGPEKRTVALAIKRKLQEAGLLPKWHDKTMVREVLSYLGAAPSTKTDV